MMRRPTRHAGGRAGARRVPGPPPHPRARQVVPARGAGAAAGAGGGRAGGGGGGETGADESGGAASPHEFKRRLEREYMQGRIEEAKRKGQAECEEGPSPGCAAAWEEVEELSEAAARKNLLEPNWFDEDGEENFLTETLRGQQDFDPLGEAIPPGLRGVALQGRQVRGAQDPLQDVKPCEIYECVDPENTLEQAGALESLLAGGAGGPGMGDAADLPVEQAIRQAAEVCEEDFSAPDCAVAWDQVEELSAEASRKKGKKKGGD